jgi:type II secretory ATPase GspE/PulE/Tfp pilus assembly ATPase PilB-like protein
MLDTVDFYTRNVVTVEDPIEYVLPNASQIEVNVKANITFANALRNILRQDPDVICVGEIRDGETAAMALQASQTGHLVLATLHSSSNLAALVRLMDLGTRPLLLASALDVIVSQRLVRRLCDNCKKPARLSLQQISNFQRKAIDHRTIMQPNGCKKCRGTGYRGRTAILDVMRLDEDVKANLANERLSLGSLKKQGDSEGRSTLRKEGLRKVLSGMTTLDEVQRVTSHLG